MRLTSLACTGTSTGTSSSSVRVRLKSGSCSMITSRASVNRRLQKVIVNSASLRSGYQGGELQECVSAQMRLIAHPSFSGIGTNHPYRNLQPPACWIYNRNCTISPFWSPGDSQTITVQGMKRIENADVRRIRTQGTVGGCCCILTCIASFPAAASVLTACIGSDARTNRSSFPWTY